MRPLLPALALALVSLVGPPAVAQQAPPPRIYRWVDENGIAHYTTDPERIPKSLRLRFGLPAQPLTRDPLDAHAPGPALSPKQKSDPDAWAAQEKSAAPPIPSSAEPAAAFPEAHELGAAVGPSENLAQLELRIAELSAAIAADEDTLASFIGDPNQRDPMELGDKPEYREIALRLPKRLEELEALRNERDALLTETAH